MDEDEEQFYDSLEEDLHVEHVEHVEQDGHSAFQDAISTLKSDASQYELCDEPTDEPPPTKKPQKTKIPVRETKIPLYAGETTKADLKILKNKSPHKTPSSSKPSQTCIACEKSKLKGVEVKKKEVPSSYWTLHCQKYKITTPIESEDALKTFYGSENNKTFRSSLSGTTWDAPSVFQKYIPKTYANTTKKNDTQSLFLEENISLDGEYKSVSNMDITKTPRMIPTRIGKCRSNTSNISFRPLTLKCVGPDPERLEQLRKQQDYGRRVSSRNRARIIQNLTKVTNVLKGEK